MPPESEWFSSLWPENEWSENINLWFDAPTDPAERERRAEWEGTTTDEEWALASEIISNDSSLTLDEVRATVEAVLS